MLRRLSSSENWVGFALALVIACAGAPTRVHAQACGLSRDGTLFQIGLPDGYGLEFGLTKETWRGYAKRYPDPIVFTVGKDSLHAWPYIHPSHDDLWAGGKSHTFTLRFILDEVPEPALHLIIGQSEAFKPSLLTVTVNGKELASRRVPGGSGSGSGDPSEWGKPAAMVFALPQGALRVGENDIALTLAKGSWIIYDYIYLGTNPEPAKISTGTEGLLARFMEGPMRGVEEIVFAARKLASDGHWYANFGYFAYDANRKVYAEGGKLYRLNLKTGKLTTLLADSRGGVRDPQVHYDGHKILFSYRRGGTDHFHLYEINADGTNLRQLTDGPFDDIEPTYMPDGGIVFVSSRCNRWVNCWLTKVAVLYRCDADGSNIRALSSNNEHDNTPWPMPDGRILYTRWEYVDRSQVHFHHLWTANPDGTGQMTWFGNMHPGITMIDAKPIPGTDKVVASFSPGHGLREHDGHITVVDPSGGPDAKEFAKRISRSHHFRDPWAFSEDCFLAASRDTLVVMDETGRLQEILKLSDEDRAAGLECHEPRPLVPRPRERLIHPRINPSDPNGRYLLADIYDGRNMDGIQEGEIKKLLVLETLPMPIHFTGGMEPLTYGGSFTLERILGTVPVEDDGSAFFEVPAMRSVFFVALDEKDISVKRMQSFTTVQPGEIMSCVGCHEHRSQTPRSEFRPTLALRKPPAQIEPIRDVPDVLDYPRDIQPILNRHCIQCHDYDHPGKAGGVFLTGDRGPMFTISYFTLTARRQIADGRNLPKSNYAPRELGSGGSALMRKIEPEHYNVQLSDLEKKTIRLWIETGAAHPGTYAALGSGMIGAFNENQLDRSDTEWPTTKASMAALQNRCAGCHDKHLPLPTSPSHEHIRPPWEYMGVDDPRRRISRHLLYNLTRPEKSLLLLAPLSKNAGGFGLCKTAWGGEAASAEPAEVFRSTGDPDYQTILTAITDAKKHLDEIKRFDMPGFRPRYDWVREMKRYGILPAGTAAEEVTDVYAVERAYWESLWYQPPASLGDSSPGGGE
jgi:hypothetical protein